MKIFPGGRREGRGGAKTDGRPPACRPFSKKRSLLAVFLLVLALLLLVVLLVLLAFVLVVAVLHEGYLLSTLVSTGVFLPGDLKIIQKNEKSLLTTGRGTAILNWQNKEG